MLLQFLCRRTFRLKHTIIRLTSSRSAYGALTAVRLPSYALDKAVEVIKNAKKPLLICSGGVRYAEAHKVFKKFAEDFGIAFGETQAGKSAVVWGSQAEPPVVWAPPAASLQTSWRTG